MRFITAKQKLFITLTHYASRFLGHGGLIVYTIRFYFNKNSVIVLLSLSLASWAQEIGIHPGVLLVVMLMAVEFWFLPHQSSSYQIAYYSTDEKAFSHSQARKLMIAKLFVSLIAIAISVPYWRIIGLIR